MSDWGERGTCPQCGSAEVTHIVFGFPADPESAPPWISFGGCVTFEGPSASSDRACDRCGHSWVSRIAPDGEASDAHRSSRAAALRPRRAGPRRRPPLRAEVSARGGVRLLGAAGASVALLPVPGPKSRDSLLVDIELLTPERLVRYLARGISRDFIGDLAAALLQAAADVLPEVSVPTVEDAAGGITVRISDSTPLSVGLEISVVSATDGDVLNYDGVGFEVPRASLVRAAHGLKSWLS